MAKSSKRHEEHSTLIKEIRASTSAAIRNQGALIKELEIQIGQMSKSITTKKEAETPSIHHIRPNRYSVSNQQKENRMSLTKISRANITFLGRLREYGYDENEEEIKAKMNEHCSTVIEWDLPPKERDPRSFTLPCTINNIRFNKALADLGASVSVMPYSTFTNLGLGKLASLKLIIELADKTVKRPKGIAENVLVEIDKFVFLVDFVILDIAEDFKTSLILGRRFLSTAHAKIDILEDPEFEDFIKLNDLNEPLELRNHEIEDLGPIIGEGEVIDELNGDLVKTIDDNVMVEKIDEYPIIKDFAVLENIDAYRDKDMMSLLESHFVEKYVLKQDASMDLSLSTMVSTRDKLEGKLHPYQKLKDLYKGMLNLGPEYIKDEKTVEWLTRGHVSTHEMDLKLEQALIQHGLCIIASTIGKPIMLDSYTSSMCIESWGRSSFARSLIEINAQDVLQDSLTIGILCEDDRFSIEYVSIEYEWKPPRYDLCKIFGHSHDYCPKKVLIPIVDTSKVITPNVGNIPTVHIPSVEKTNDGFQTVGKKKKKKGKSKSNNGDQFVGNTSNSSSLMKNTINSSNQDNITSSNSFAALNEDVEEGEVENVFDETANLFNSKNRGWLERSSLWLAVWC
ncbi:DNA/RNA polymerases superfamily protein [Tanacetum coccineum]